MAKKLLAIVLITLLVGSVLAACAGTARIDVDVDPDTGQGTIDIIGGGDGSSQQDGSSSTGIGVDNAILFAAVAFLLGVIAIVIAINNNRPR